MKNFLVFLFIALAPFRALAIDSFNALSVRTVYTGSNVTTSTALQLVASIPYATQSILVFDNGGSTMRLNITNPGGIVTNVIVPPGGAGMPLKITAGSSISIIGLSGTPPSGAENDINFFY